jgi:tetratricopeptide (TPR) repeat protein
MGIVKKTAAKKKSSGLMTPKVKLPQPKPAARQETTNKPTQLRALCERLDKWIFTDYAKAKVAVQELAAQINSKTAYDIRLAYHRSAAFLDNQWQHNEQAIYHAREAIAICEGLGAGPALIELWADLASTYVNRRDWAEAQECLDNARRYVESFTPPTLLAHISCREGYLYMLTGNTSKAFTSFMEAEKELFNLDERSSLKDNYVFTLVLSGIGRLYEKLDEKEKSLEAYQRVFPVVERHNLRPRLAWHYLNASRVALAGKDFFHARMGLLKVLEIAGEGDEEARTHALGNLGILAITENKLDEATRMFDEAAALYEPPTKESDYNNLSKIEVMRSGIYRWSGDLKEAEKHLLKAWEIGQFTQDKSHLAQVSQSIAQLKAASGAYQEAYEWQQHASELSQQHFEDLRDYERKELEARHQLERNRQEAQMAKLRVASLQLRALRAQMNPHFMFNALNAIQGFITSGRNSEAESYLAKFAKMMRHTLDYSDLEVVSLEQEIEFLERYLDINRKLRFREKLHFKIISPKELDLGDLHVPTMILQPFVENAIEHGIRPRQEGTLTIEFKLPVDDRTILCIIEDDGVGYKKGQEKQSNQAVFQRHRSRGMDITRERLNLIHQLENTGIAQLVTITDLGVQSEGARSGTRVEVVLPLMESD